MCGFPLTHLDRHLKRLVQGHKRFAAVCEEFKQPDGTFKRRVTRVVTPGTLIDESFVNPFENNYLLAVGVDSSNPNSAVGLAWTDVATGEFYSQTVSVRSFRDEITRIGPREVVLPLFPQDLPLGPIRQALAEEEATISFIIPKDLPSTLDSSPSLPSSDLTQPNIVDDDPMPVENPALTEQQVHDVAPNETQAIATLQAFLRESLLEHLPSSSNRAQSIHQSSTSRMQIDAHTIKALELRHSSRDGGVTGSLLSVVKRTVTSGGTRLLGRWLCESLQVLNCICG